MSLTASEQKKMKKIESQIAQMEEERDELKRKAAENFAKQAIKLGLWKLDKKTIELALSKIAKDHGL